MNDHKTTITVKSGNLECTVIHPNNLESSIDAFIVALQGVGYHKDSITRMMYETAEEHEASLDSNNSTCI